MNLFYNNKGQLVYPAACLGVVYDYENMAQSYFGGGETKVRKKDKDGNEIDTKGGRKQNDDSKDSHTDDVTALAVSKSKKLVASG